MGIEIVLYSSSPVVQKIFFHLLYHYSPTVHRVDKPSMLVEKVQYTHPDIIFIDGTLSGDLQTQIKAKKEELKDIPIILMSTKELDKQALESSAAQGVLKKPISAGPLQELIVRFVPKAKSNILTRYLKFAPIPTFEENSDLESPSKADLSLSQNEKSSPSSTVQEGASPSGGIDLITENNVETEEVNKTSSSPSDSSSVTSAPSSKERDSSPGIELVTATKRREIKEEEEKGGTAIGPAPFFVDKEPNQNVGDVSKNKDEKKDKDEKKTKDQPVAKTEKTVPILDPTEVKIMKSKWQEPSPPSQLDSSDEVGTAELHKKERKKELDFNTQLKDQINDYIQKWTKEQIKTEVEKQLKKIVEQQSQEIIQKTAEKTVWQVVPSLAKQLITKELEKLLKEEDEGDK
ncbi:MAG: response regulator [Bdellovibrionales bacterium]|nr:response regulator [Bdellovibrionales bacterium]